MKENKFWNSEKLIGMVAFVISIGTLFTFIYQTNIMREHQRASVLPYLEIWNSRVGNQVYELNLYNNGIGPAFIQDIKVKYKDTVINIDTVINGDPDRLVRYLMEHSDTSKRFTYRCSNIKKGRLIRAGEKISMVAAHDSSETVKTLRKIFNSKKTTIEITYSSIYNEKWITRGVAVPPVKIE